MDDRLSTTLNPTSTYETTELKLAAFILAEIPDSSFEVHAQPNSSKKLIDITFSEQHKEKVQELISEFIERRARVDLYRFNKVLNPLRDALKENGPRHLK